MSLHTDISSFQNPYVKQIIKLRNKRERDRSQLFLIEGFRELQRALKGCVECVTVFYAKEFFLGSNSQGLVSEFQKNGVEIRSVSADVFSKCSYRDRPDGLLAIAKHMDTSLDMISVQDNQQNLHAEPFFLLAEGIEKPGNLGTILRSSDAAGVNGLIVCDQCTDLFNPNVVRSSVGTLFTVPSVSASADEAWNWIQRNRLRLIATTPDAKVCFTDADLLGPVILAVGTEQFGLSRSWLDRADLCVKIPMHGVADSLNVATATTLVLYEVLRQRRKLC